MNGLRTHISITKLSITILWAMALSQALNFIDVQALIKELPYSYQDGAVNAPGPTPNAGGKKASSRYAYAFVVGGCDPDKPTYKNFLYDILITAHILRESGSKADIVAFFQMSYASAFDELTEQDISWLQAMDIRTYYIPKAQDESFYSISIDKFRILGLTQYRRVLFFDTDVLPLGNTDYIFELSERGIIKENLVVAALMAPANAGFFLVTPYKTALQEVEGIIRQKDEFMRKQPRKWNEYGWGHKIQPPDQWVTHQGSGIKWNFNGANADQGMLYYYTKYYRQQVSIVNGSSVYNWGRDESTGEVVLEETLENPFREYSRPTYPGLVDNCHIWSGPSGCFPPHTDYVHFAGLTKPWKHGYPADLSIDTKGKSAIHVWFYTLQLLNDKLSMGLERQLQPRKWKTKNLFSPLGFKPKAGVAIRENVTLRNSIAAF